MLGYCTLGTNDLANATDFYDKLLSLLGARRVLELERGVIYGINSLSLGLLIPANGEQASVGNGVMVALQASSRRHVDEVYLEVPAKVSRVSVDGDRTRSMAHIFVTGKAISCVFTVLEMLERLLEGCCFKYKNVLCF